MVLSLGPRKSVHAPRAVRRIASAALGYAAAVCAARYILPSGFLLWCAAGLGLASLFALFLRGNARERALLLLLSAAVGLFWYRGYQALFIEPAEALAGETVTVTARVTEYSEDRGSYSVRTVRLTQEGLPKAKIAVYDFNGEMPELVPGDIVSASLNISSATVSYGEETDAYSSRGIFLRAFFESPPELKGRSALAFLYFPKTAAKWVQDSVAELFPRDTAGYVKALLTGDKSGLYEDPAVCNALGTAGIRHTVAVSGMHLSFLWGLLCLLTVKKRRAALFGIPVLWFYALAAGFTPSVVRAAFMLSLLAAAPLLRRESDGLTSLSAVLLLMLVVNPRSVGSVSLQLSFSAMAGILLVSPRIYNWCGTRWKKPEKGRARFRHFVIASFSASIGATVFTVPLSALHFGYVSLVSPLTNMLVLWALPFCFVGGYLAVVAGAVFAPLGVGTAWLVSCIVRYIIFVAKTLSVLPFAAVYTAGNLVGWWLVFAYAVFLFAWLRRGDAPFRPAIPISVSVIALSAVLTGATVFHNASASVTAIDVGQGQSIAVFEGSDTVLIDCGGTGTWEDAGDTAANFLMGSGRTRIDVLVLTHLHEDHAGGVEELMYRMKVGCLALPSGTDDGDGLRDGILEAAEANGTEVLYISKDTDVTVGNISLRLFAPLQAGDENERGVIIIASIGDYDILVTGDVNAAVERRLIESAALPDFELLVAGHHGSRYSTSYELLDAIGAETAVISVGYNTYGHPTEDVLWRLSAYGMEVLRTDEAGNITIRIGKNGQ